MKRREEDQQEQNGEKKKRARGGNEIMQEERVKERNEVGEQLVTSKQMDNINIQVASFEAH